MTRSTRTISILAAMLIAVSACGSSPPELPPDSPSAMVEVLTSDTGNADLKKLTTYEWDDDGAAVGAQFTWIGENAASTDGAVAAQAAQAAAALAEFLIADHAALMAVGSGFLGLSKVPAAQLNPLLVRSYSAALAPFFGDLVGGQQQAFETVRTEVLADPSALRNLLSVLVADPEAGRTAVETARVAAERYEDAAAADPPGGDESVTDLTAAGSLLGSSFGAVKQEGSDIPTRTSGEALNDMAVRIASTLVRSDPNPAKVSKYVQDGALMTPDEVERTFSNAAMRTYFLDLQDYISTKGFGDGLSAFQDAFKATSNEAAR